jgi:NAD(P)-dependent dehydrogenase (short-subunit alcohol dehydrogenase family)
MGKVTFDFNGQVALVTGAASGMGLAAAKGFAAAGASVVLMDVSEAALHQVEADLKAEGRDVLALTCDVSDEGQVESAISRAMSQYGRLDAAFNNAGIQVPPSDAADETFENFEKVNAVNMRGVWTCMKHELRQMREQGSGAIVNCSSLGGLVGLPSRAAYHASKHGVIGLTRSAAMEYAPRGVRINAVCPGVINTPMVSGMLVGQAEAMKEIMREQPIGRLGEAEEIADVVLWLCSAASSFVIGQAIAVDGGFTIH